MISHAAATITYFNSLRARIYIIYIIYIVILHINNVNGRFKRKPYISGPFSGMKLNVFFGGFLFFLFYFFKVLY